MPKNVSSKVLVRFLTEKKKKIYVTFDNSQSWAVL